MNDPLNKVNGVSQPFPGNIVPTSRLDSNGLALLKILPLPNFVNPAITGYNYNYQIQEVIDFPKRFQVFKIDYVPREKDRIWVRGKTFLSEAPGLLRFVRRHSRRILRAMLLFFGRGDCGRLDSRLFADPRLRNDHGGTPQS